MNKTCFSIVFILSSLLLISFSGLGVSQVLNTDPLIPSANGELTVYFHTDQEPAAQPLHNFTGDLYAHTGVIVSGSTAWQFVIGTWGNNTNQPKLEYMDSFTYKLVITPSIYSYYTVPLAKTIEKVALVFRSADATKQTQDYFVTVYPEGLNVSFTQPSSVFTLALAGQTIPVQVSSTSADSIHLLLDDSLLATSTTSSIITNVIASGTHRHMLVALAWGSGESTADTILYLVKGTTVNAVIPTGAKDGINYTDEQTVTFVLYAPYKSTVYLIGDFNDWMPDSAYLFNKFGDRFWITLSGVETGKEYAFQYLIDGNLHIADPYCDKILDPWNDKYISSTIYPNLKSYPEGKTSEIAGVIQTAQPSYTWEASDYTPPQNDKLVIYELLIRDFTLNRDIKTVTDTLSYLKRLGVNAIELMPFNEFEGNSSWGYNPDFYFAPDKAYGTKNDYKKFIDECHKQGIAVIMDMVLNHTYSQSPMVRMYFDGTNPTAQNPWYNVTSPNTSYSWGNDFNHQRQVTKDFVDRVTSYWLTEYKLDGFRFDFTKGFTNTTGDGWAYDAQRIAIIKRMATAIWGVNPAAYVILEHFTDNSEEKELANFGCMIWGNMNGKYNEATMGYNENGKSDLSWNSFVNRGWNDPNLVGYMESHDEERLMFKNLNYGNKVGVYNIKNLHTALKRQELASCFFYTIPGPKMLYEFGELGFDLSINSGGDRTAIKPAHWEYYDNLDRRALFNLTAELIKLKKTETVFSTHTFTLDAADSIKQIQLTDGLTQVVAVGNFGMLTHPVAVDFSIPGRFYSYFNGDSIDVGNLDPTITMKPGEFRLYTNTKFSGFASVITEVLERSGVSTLSIYPNPAKDRLYLSSNDELVDAEVFSIEGRLIIKNDPSRKNFIDISNLIHGIYMVKASTRNGEKILTKFIKE